MTTRLRIEWEPEPDWSYLDQKEFEDTTPDQLDAYCAFVDHICAECDDWHDGTGDSLGNIHVETGADLTGAYTTREMTPESLRFLWDEMEGLNA